MLFVQAMGRRLKETPYLSNWRFATKNQLLLVPRADDPKATQPTESIDETVSSLHGPKRTLAIASILTSMVLVVLDGAVANAALPTIAKSLHVTPAMSIRVITSYQCALLMALLPCAALGESFGFRRVFSGGVALFIAAAMLSALSPSLNWLVAARFLQGLGSAAIMSLGVALLRSIVLPQQLGAAIGWNALAVALSSAAGPAIGAAVVSVTTWHWLFAFNLPLGVLVMLSTRALPRSRGTRRRIDLVSVVLNAGAFATLVVAAELLPARPTLAAIMFIMAVIEMMLLVLREIPKTAPLIPIDLLRVGSFRFSVIASVCCFAGQTAGMVALPFYLQHGLGQTSLMVGFYMMPWPLAVAVTAPIAGRLANRVSTTWLCAVGGMCLAVGLGAAALWPLKIDPRPLVSFMILCGIGFGLFNVANNRNMFMSAPDERSGAAGGMQGTARLCGQTAGAVIISLLYTLASADSAPRISLGIGALLTFGAALVSMIRVNPLRSG